MRSLSAEMKAHMAGEVTTLATCWRIQRRDGVALGFTNHDRDLVVDGFLYRAAGGVTASALSSSNGAEVDNQEVEGVLSSVALRAEDLEAGRYDHAVIEVSMVNWADPGQGRMILRSGHLGDMQLNEAGFTAELRGLTQALQGNIAELFSPECRAALGDHRCKVSMAGFTVAGAVTSVADQATFSDSARSEADGWFDYGVLSWLTGENGGLEVEVRRFAGGEITLLLPMTGLIQAGDRYRLTAGCDKRFATCQAKFANTANFRGEPSVPGQDAVLDYPGLA